LSKDKIIITDLLVRGIIGVNDWERKKKQDIVLNLDLQGDMRTAGDSDDIRDVLNYRNLTKRIIEHVETGQPYLVEALAHQIARIAVQEFGADQVTVRIEKPGALRFARSVGVQIERTAHDFR